jgi:hypothetical protein
VLSPIDSLMVALLLYGYCTGVSSSRQIERRSHEDVAFHVIAGGAHPNHVSISEFRRVHLDALSGLFLQVLKLCQKYRRRKAIVEPVFGQIKHARGFPNLRATRPAQGPWRAFPRRNRSQPSQPPSASFRASHPLLSRRSRRLGSCAHPQGRSPEDGRGKATSARLLLPPRNPQRWRLRQQSSASG